MQYPVTQFNGKVFSLAISFPTVIIGIATSTFDAPGHVLWMEGVISLFNNLIVLSRSGRTIIIMIIFSCFKVIRLFISNNGISNKVRDNFP